MAKSTPVFFPSLYDKSVSTSPEDHFNIWKKLGITMKDQPEPKTQAEEILRWPPGLADIRYEPLSFFSSPVQEDFKPQPSHLDDLCELEIQIKEIELLTITGDEFDAQKYHYLKAVKDKMMLDRKGMQDRQKPTLAS